MPHDVPPGAWGPARRVVRAVVSPIQRFLAVEAASGILLVVATAIALVAANTGLHHRIEAILDKDLGVTIGDIWFARPLHFWINDGLMTVFFFVVGLEIRKEIFEGELQTLRRAALPLLAALGGMVVPAVIYTAINAGHAGARGWAIPMATDIAFAVGVLALLGARVPHSLRVLLLGLAVIDDIGAIVVIAAFYSSGLQLDGFGVAAVGVALALLMRYAAIRAPLLYVFPGAIVWFGLYLAGVHPTLAGVVLGLLTPVRAWFGPAGFAEATKEHLEAIEGDGLLPRLDAIEAARKEAVSPAERLIHVLHPWVAFAIMPLFAFANAGVSLEGVDLSGDARLVCVGVALGLFAGKTVGIAGTSLLATRLGLATRSAELTRGGVVLVGLTGGIGFTMALFVAQLAFRDEALLAAAKLGILVGSAGAAVTGLAWGRFVLARRSPGAADS